MFKRQQKNSQRPGRAAERREDGTKAAMKWRADIWPQWHPGPESLSTGQRCRAVCAVSRRELWVLLGRLRQKLGGLWVALCTRCGLAIGRGAHRKPDAALDAESRAARSPDPARHGGLGTREAALPLTQQAEGAPVAYFRSPGPSFLPALSWVKEAAGDPRGSCGASRESLSLGSQPPCPGKHGDLLAGSANAIRWMAVVLRQCQPPREMGALPPPFGSEKTPRNNNQKNPKRPAPSCKMAATH